MFLEWPLLVEPYYLDVMALPGMVVEKRLGVFDTFLYPLMRAGVADTVIPGRTHIIFVVFAHVQSLAC